MHSVRIQNLRSLVDTGHIEIKPITLLLGQNSSGKSTFLRFFPLLRQSYEARTTGPLLWYGRFVDFGSFEDALYRGANEQEISCSFTVRLTPDLARFAVGLPRTEDSLDVEMTLGLTEEPQSRATRSTRLRLTFEGQRVDLQFSTDGAVVSLNVNGQDLTACAKRLHVTQRAGVVPTLFEAEEEEEKESREKDDTETTAGNLLKVLSRYVHGKTSRKRLAQLANRLIVGSSERALERMRSITLGGPIWSRYAKKWDVESVGFKAVRDAHIAASIEDMLDMINASLSTTATSVRYIAPVRATAERYYRFQDLAVDEVDFQGKNLAMYLQSLRRDDFDEFSKWIDGNFGFKPSIAERGDHISISLRETGSGYEFNLADTGFGFSQVLPVLTQLWVLGTRPRPTTGISRGFRIRRPSSPVIYAVEQPELHLHPRLQARLADILLAIPKLASSRGIDIRLLVETHSESIVNRLGHHASKDDTARQIVSVVLFEREDPNLPTRVRISQFDDQGFLKYWPLGFFEPDPLK